MRVQPPKLYERPGDIGYIRFYGFSSGISFAFNGVAELQAVEWPAEKGIVGDGFDGPEVNSVLPERGEAAVIVSDTSDWHHIVGGSSSVVVDGAIPGQSQSKTITIEVPGITLEDEREVSGIMEATLSWTSPVTSEGGGNSTSSGGNYSSDEGTLD